MQHAIFNALVEPLQGKVFRLAKRLLISNEEAQDATQEVLLKLWAIKDGLAQYQNVEAFAMKIAKNYCLDQLKSKRAAQLRLVDAAAITANDQIEKLVEINDSWQRVENLIDALPAQQKIIIQLRDIEQYEFREIAEITEMNEVAIRVALSRARKTIRQQIIKWHNYGL